MKSGLSSNVGQNPRTKMTLSKVPFEYDRCRLFPTLMSHSEDDESE